MNEEKQEGRRQPVYHIAMCNVKARDKEGLPRSNNQLESWDNALQGMTERFIHPFLYL